MVDVRLLEVLFPRFASVRVDEVARDGDRVSVRARVRKTGLPVEVWVGVGIVRAGVVAGQGDRDTPGR
jgi:hypothetical protein